MQEPHPLPKFLQQIKSINQSANQSIKQSSEKNKKCRNQTHTQNFLNTIRNSISTAVPPTNASTRVATSTLLEAYAGQLTQQSWSNSQQSYLFVKTFPGTKPSNTKTHSLLRKINSSALDCQKTSDFDKTFLSNECPRPIFALQETDLKSILPTTKKW